MGRVKTVIEAFVTNLGKYVEGELCGEYLKFPATKKDVQDLFSRIGIDGVLYEEYFITDYESGIKGLRQVLGEYESIDELNYLAALIKDLDEYELEKFTAAVEYGEDISDIADLINLTQNLENYIIYPEVADEEDLGHFFIEELSALEIPEHLEKYFDYGAYGRDISFNSNGIFSETCGGYLEQLSGEFTEHYKSRDDLPDEYKIFAYPDTEKMSIKDRLSMYKQMISPDADIDKPYLVRDEI